MVTILVVSLSAVLAFESSAGAKDKPDFADPSKVSVKAAKLVKPFHANGLSQCTLKTSENLRFRGYRRDQWHEMVN